MTIVGTVYLCVRNVSDSFVIHNSIYACCLKIKLIDLQTFQFASQ